jgi:hypothetical protein
VDAIVSADELINTARQWALDIFHGRRPWVVTLHKTDKIEPLGEAREILKLARAEAKKQAPNVQYPVVCIDVIEEGIVSGPRAGLWKVRACLSPSSFTLSPSNSSSIQLLDSVSHSGCRRQKLFRNFSFLTLQRV